MKNETDNKNIDQDAQLAELREALSQVDRELLELYTKREKMSHDVWEVKKNMDQVIYVPTQEETKISRLLKDVPEDQKDRLTSFYRTVFRLSREVQYEDALKSEIAWPLGVELKKAMGRAGQFKTMACQGTVGSYSSQAAQFIYPDADVINIRSFDGAAAQVAQGNVDAAVLPLENSTAGTIEDVYQLIDSLGLFIVDTIDLNIRHHLAALPGTKIAQIERVMSHPQALAQCSAFIRSMGWTTEVIANTAFAAREVARLGKNNVAAISSEKAATSNGLDVLMSGISNQYVNQTRFAVVTNQPVIRPEATHVSLQFSLPHQPGTLGNYLSIFADLGLNVTKIQSRPIADRPWEYRFFLEFAGVPVDPAAKRLLLQFASELPEFRFMGWYQEHLPQDVGNGVGI